MQYKIIVTLIFAVSFYSCSKKIIPEKPSLAYNIRRLDTLPLSEIDVPVKINLKPLYELAEKNVEVTYTSPGWPYDFVVENCDTRYMYKFRRGPLQLNAKGNQMQFGFTGFYQLLGSQRVCAGTGSNRAPLTPWSPPCTCGLKEGERKVNVSFTTAVGLKHDFTVHANINRMEPVPVDKCTVCFWGQDITKTVMERLKAQLDDAKKSMEDTINTINLRPQFQKIWDMLNTHQNLYNLGYLQINPQKIRISNFSAYGDTMLLSLGLSAKPVVTQSREEEIKTVVPDISDFSQRKGFNIYVDTYLDYDSLSNLLTAQAKDKRIELGTGGKYIIIKQCEVYGANNERLIVKVTFTGSDDGIFYLTGKPEYNSEKKLLQVRDLDFDIKTKNFLMKTASWLFNGKITRELQPYTRFEAAAYESNILVKLNSELNREIKKGIFMNGHVNAIQITKIYPFTEKLVVRLNSSGDLNLLVNSLKF